MSQFKNASELKAALSEGVKTVTFTKKDGTTRVMKCTMNYGLIPETNQPKNKNESGTESSLEETQLLKVYDLEVQGWRSFNFDQVNLVD